MSYDFFSFDVDFAVKYGVDLAVIYQVITEYKHYTNKYPSPTKLYKKLSFWSPGHIDYLLGELEKNKLI